MKNIITLTLTLIVALLLPTHLFADAQKSEWFGDWRMNHDGHVGALKITELKGDCASSPWCNISISYVDSEGIRRTGDIEKFDDRWQHMSFYINFPGNRQRFDAYLFSWDKLNMAGTTYWGGRTFGLYATKNSVASQQSSGEVVSRTILPNGVVEIHYADGTIKQIGKSGTTTIFPDGRRSTIFNVNAPAPEPPLLPSDSPTLKKWREYHNESLLDVIKTLVKNDQSAIDVLLNGEGGMSLYQKINGRTEVIGRLLTGR